MDLPSWKDGLEERDVIPANTSRVVELKIPSQLGYERVAREAAAAVARRLGFSSERVEELKTAVGEACTNAIRHGSNADARMKVVVLLTADETKLDILVKDVGVGDAPSGEVVAPDIQAQVEGRNPPGGLGLWLIRQMVDEAYFVDDVESAGNQFRMIIYRLADDRRPGEDASPPLRVGEGGSRA
jgi:serine/threonine-protein kinase RsbW